MEYLTSASEETPRSSWYARHGVASALFLVVLGALFFTAASPAFLSAQTADAIAKRRAQLERELAKIEEQIKYQQILLTTKQKERVSLERDIAILDAQIEKARLDIRARELVIEGLSADINGKENTIGELDQKLAREKEALAQLVRKTNELDQVSLVEIVLSNKNLSDFFEEFDDLRKIKIALARSSEALEQLKDAVRSERDALAAKRREEVELKTLQELQKQEVEDREAQKRKILTETRGQEARYQALIQAKERTAADIRAELFALRDTSAIPFGEALDYATRAGKKTGVRPALILGVLTQETKLGEFLGTGNYRSDMHPTRDVPLFLALTKELGLNPNSMPVSKKPSYGWGGAMGPAQFIPSTWACYGGWVNVKTGDCSNARRTMAWDRFWAGPWRYEKSQDRLRAISGRPHPSNPWDKQDAFFATALLLKDNGADRGGYEAERLAALRYFAGWGNATNPAYAFYGDGVMRHTAYYQRQINILQRAGR